MSILLVDFGAVFWREWHVSADQSVNHAARLTLQRVQALARQFGNDGVAVCLDSSPNWRKRLWDGYKANRPAKDAAALEQLRAAQQMLADYGYPLFSVADAEADDVIAGLVWSDTLNGYQCVIASADKDLGQLLGDGNCSMWHLGRNVEIADVRAAYGLLGIEPPAEANPWQWNTPAAARSYVDALTLIGDKADNVPGVDGCGPKRAWEWLHRYGSIEAIHKAATAQAEKGADGPFTARQLSALLDAFGRPDCDLWLSRTLIDLHECAHSVHVAVDNDAVRVFEKPNENRTVVAMSTETIETETAAEVVEITAERQSEPGRKADAPLALTPAANWERALEPVDTRQAFGLAKMVIQSRMFAGFGTPEQVLLVLMAGREHGLGAMASLRGFHVVEGRPTMSAQMMMAVCVAHSSCKLFRVRRSECTAERAVVEVQRHGWDSPETYVWTLEDAKRAGLAGKNNWAKYPRDMLVNRCIAEAARFTWPELLANCYAPEEFGGVS